MIRHKINLFVFQWSQWGWKLDIGCGQKIILRGLLVTKGDYVLTWLVQPVNTAQWATEAFLKLIINFHT